MKFTSREFTEANEASSGATAGPVGASASRLRQAADCAELKRRWAALPAGERAFLRELMDWLRTARGSTDRARARAARRWESRISFRLRLALLNSRQRLAPATARPRPGLPLPGARPDQIPAAALNPEGEPCLA
jgi:hypothetical protein